MRALTFALAACLAFPAFANPPTETQCSDGQDNDGDGLSDCGDGDCKSDAACQPDGGQESTDARCSDWIDNDKDGHVDCDDKDCEAGHVKVCKGSWRSQDAGGGTVADDEELPELGEGQSVEDLIGKGSDKDGERNDQLCSDGIDNDDDGRTDCADFGCRFDPSVTVCRGNLGMRFSIVANVVPIEFIFPTADGQKLEYDTRFSKLQLRSFGPIPMIQDSFYLISMRAEKTPRVTFAMFSLPLGAGHKININSGSGGLSYQTVISSAKQLLIDSPFYLTSAFEQANSMAVEFEGPIDDSGISHYRGYLAGGQGFSTGNIGGRFFDIGGGNFTWGAGAQVQINALGRYSRFDTQFLYTDVAPTLAFMVGGKYDRRPNEEYVAINGKAAFRWWIFAASAETYYKHEFTFGSNQISWNAQLGVLLVPKHLMLGADVGEFIAGEPEKLEAFNTAADGDRELRRQLNEFQWRVALHWYFWRNVGVASLAYADRELEPTTQGQVEPDRERNLKLEIQYRF